jgi:Tol biopolymer transport system component
LTAYPGAETSPSFSPDGNQVAFSWNGEKQDNFDIYIKLVGPGAPLRLTTHPALDAGPAWSPDGRFIAFGRLLRGKIAILLIPALGGPERQVAEASVRPPFATTPGVAWTPDSKWLVVPRRDSPEEPFGLSLVSIETGETRRLTSPPGAAGAGAGDTGPAFSPDGRALVFRPVDLAGRPDFRKSELVSRWKADHLRLERRGGLGGLHHQCGWGQAAAPEHGSSR